MNREHTTSRRWAVILAGGEGTRMRDWIARRTGRPTPKQYCAFTGNKTMLKHTAERAVRAVGEDRIVTVIARHHWAHLEDQDSLGEIIAQPKNCDTAPGVLLPLSRILYRDPDAGVLLLPADHFIGANNRFQEHIDIAWRLSERFKDHALLLAARPDRPETDYGWIRPDGYIFDSGNPVARTVSGFEEKPNAARAEQFLRQGYLWNTLITVGKARTLWELAKRALPDLVRRFERIHDTWAHSRRDSLIDAAYEDMPRLNFSSDVLEKVSDRTIVMPMNGVIWSDWGRPERVIRTVEGLRPARVPAPGARLPAAYSRV